MIFMSGFSDLNCLFKLSRKICRSCEDRWYMAPGNDSHRKPSSCSMFAFTVEQNKKRGYVPLQLDSVRGDEPVCDALPLMYSRMSLVDTKKSKKLT